MRRATPADVEFVMSLFALPHVARHMHAPTPEVFASALDRENGEIFIIERDGSAFGNLVLERDETWLLTIRALAVWEPRLGAGRFALEYAIRRAFEAHGVDRIFLEVVETNTAARSLYEQLGFKQEGTYRNGFRHADGTFHNLIPYGMLDSDRRASSGSPFQRIDHIQLAMPAGEEERARGFYAGALGLEEVRKPDDLAKRGGAWFRSNDVVVHLGVDPEFRPATKAHPAFRCSNYQSLVERLQRSGVTVAFETESFDGRAHCYIVDPFGNRIELIA
jgi:catechol 2,3-dioxygenase-like lactoylglutathione lyase family enzyme/GNAT superfamily N-acetyltransferase